MQHTMHNFLPTPYCSKVPGIYAIVNQVNNKIYVGSAMQIFKRWNSHRYDFFRNRQNPYLMRAFKKDPSAFYFEVVEEMPAANKEKRLEREQFWMDFYQSYKPEKGYNACPKARSCEGVKHGPEYSLNISKRLKGTKWSEEKKAHYRKSRIWPKGRKWTEAQRQRQSMRLKGKKPSRDIVEKRTAALRGKKYPEKGRAVLQFSPSGKFIKRFEVLAYAAKEVGVPDCNIRQCCHRNHKRSGGFYWRWADKFDVQPESVPILNNLLERPVVQIHNSGLTIGRYRNMNEAASVSGANRRTIARACKSGGKSGGFRWRFV